MPPKKRKLENNQPTLSELFARKATEEVTYDGRQHFLIDLTIAQNGNEYRLDKTLLSLSFSLLASESENEADIEVTEAVASTSAAVISDQQSENVFEVAASISGE